MEERDFFNEIPESKPAEIYCPSCRRTNTYQVRWLRRTKKASIPPRASDLDRARFAKARDYLVRVDDKLRCVTPRCGKMIEISSLQSVVFL
jgi:ribosomal protein L44E